MRFLCGVLVAVMLVNCLGCGNSAIDYSSIDLIPVTGTVAFDGEPLANARVRFIGEDGSGSEGMTDAAGRYALRYDSNRVGAKPGKKKVMITTSMPREIDDPDAKGDGEKIPAKYNSATELTAEVNSRETTHDFALRSS